MEIRTTILSALPESLRFLAASLTDLWSQHIYYRSDML